ncbi:RNA-binding protein PNO1 [Anabarilius grahami]|uniref:RNA-binding protein PNO1 n=1 Tax=Anabarilius grahami TaxID=495550 RepID=A0A3N0YDH3_ANAGA|nr:RNA-binding protein PNO1 [Anabarilius grahami]
MESVTNTTAEAIATMDCDENDGFEKVKSKRSRKRKRDAADAGGQAEGSGAAKRPQFPAISGDQLRGGSDEMRKVSVPAHRYTPLKENWMKIFTPIVENLQLQVRFNLKTRNVEIKGGSDEMRKVSVPAHRYTPLKENWMKIFTPIVENLQLQVRFNLKTRNVEIKTCKETQDIGALTRAADFVKAFILGFQVEDALALIRLDELFLETFDVTDVKPLKGDHLSRAIGRIAGKGGKTKFTIENVTKTRIVLADAKIHILGSFQNIKMARTAICNLILGE